jgi:Domain of unknown function (DUF7007)
MTTPSPVVTSAKPIFVFGSNLAGRHGKGAALFARQHRGAIYGQSVGLQGDSYAIPTKDEQLRTLPLDRIKAHVDDFLLFAGAHPALTFQVTAIGCGLAGYKPAQIAPLFADAPGNCMLASEFLHALGRDCVETPWGQSNHAEQIAPGITFYGTPSHGGFCLTPERMQAMPEHLRRCSFTKDHWFEEDCSWCAVALAFPDCFPPDAVAAARRTYDAMYRGRLACAGAPGARPSAPARS